MFKLNLSQSSKSTITSKPNNDYFSQQNNNMFFKFTYYLHNISYIYSEVLLSIFLYNFLF